MTKIKKNLSRLNATQLVDKSKFIEARMQDNPAFPDPVPALADIFHWRVRPRTCPATSTSNPE